MRRARTNSSAVLESRPRVELWNGSLDEGDGKRKTYLSQEVIRLLVASVSLILDVDEARTRNMEEGVRTTLVFSHPHSPPGLTRPQQAYLSHD